MSYQEKYQIVFGPRSSVFVVKRKKNLRLKDLSCYQKRSLKHRLMFDSLFFRFDN